MALIKELLDTLYGDVPARCALHGIHGVGKSQIFYALAKDLYDKGRYTNIFRMQATTIEKLHQGFSKLLKLMCHPEHSSTDDETRIMAARRWLEDFNSGSWLLVIDNVARDDELIYTLSTEHHFSHLSRRSRIALRSHPTHPTHSQHLSINPDSSSDVALSDIVTNHIGPIRLALHDTRGLIDTSHSSYPCRMIVTSLSLSHNSDMTHIYSTFSCPDISPSHCFFCFGHDSSVHCRVRIASEEVLTTVYKPSPPVPKKRQ